MNRTLLLILCDFLLLNLLALTRWEQAEPTRPSQRPAALTEEGGSAGSPEQDIVNLMRLSLEDERSSREQLEQRLGLTEEQLAQRQQALAQLQADRENLAANLGQTQQTAEQLRQQVEQASREALTSRERMAQLQRDLEQREAEAQRQREQLGQLEQQQAEARQRIQQLDVAVRVAEQEKSLLRETADIFRSQAESEREERMRVQESTVQLAQGVGQLAEKSAEITREMRDFRPINANTLYSEFTNNRVPVQMRAERSGLFGPVTRESSARTILVTDGAQTYALIHFDDTPFTLLEPHADWSRIEASVSRGGYRSAVPELRFLAQDPRLVVLPVSEAQVAALGVKVYETALDPFRFPEAVLISQGGAGYGEVPFRLDTTNPRFVRMDNRLVRRLFGDFSPSRGDLVLSKSGELLGVMVAPDVCALVSDFSSLRTIRTGDAGDQRTSTIFAEIAARVGLRRPTLNR
jgi:predicted  nucleic acid-binding Zn-ribbon protein